jgi:hypothetical protein
MTINAIIAYTVLINEKKTKYPSVHKFALVVPLHIAAMTKKLPENAINVAT